MDKVSTNHLSTLKMSTNGGILGLDLEERSNLIELDRQLHTHWGLGRNFILGWCPHDQGILLLVVPHYAVASYALPDEAGASEPDSPSQNFIMDLLSRRRKIDQLPEQTQTYSQTLAYLFQLKFYFRHCRVYKVPGQQPNLILR